MARAPPSSLLPTEKRPCRGSEGWGPASQLPLPHLPQPSPLCFPRLGWGSPGPGTPALQAKSGFKLALPLPSPASPATQQAPKSLPNLVPGPGTLLTHHHSFG